MTLLFLLKKQKPLLFRVIFQIVHSSQGQYLPIDEMLPFSPDDLAAWNMMESFCPLFQVSEKKKRKSSVLSFLNFPQDRVEFFAPHWHQGLWPLFFYHNLEHL